MKWLLVFVFIGLLFVGQASRVEADQSFPEYFREIERIGQIADLKAQAKAIAEFMRKVQGLGDPAKVEAAKNDLNKYTWNITGNNWAVVYESKEKTNAVASGYIMAGENPPSDAKILPTKTIRGVNR